MNQTKPKTVEDVILNLKKQEPSLFWNDAVHCSCFPANSESGQTEELPDRLVKFIRQEITSLLESFNTEFWDAPGAFTAGYNARNRELKKDINGILGKERGTTE